MPSPDYPALQDLQTQSQYPLKSATSFLVGRNETADICVTAPDCSRHHFRIVRADTQYYVEALAANNPTYLNNQPVKRASLLEHGSVLQAGSTRFRFLLHAAGDSARAIVPPVTASVKDLTSTVAAGPEELGSLSIAREIPLSAKMIIGRDPQQAQIPLDHPQVSRRHAGIALMPNQQAQIRDFGSANGTFVNGHRYRNSGTLLKPGDQIDIGPFALLFTGTSLSPRTRSNNIELMARNVSRVVTNRETGKPLKLLDDITLVIKPREFVCLLGPSGSGKSTLMTILSGRGSPNDGAVLINGKDLHANFDGLKQDIALVPQKDVLHDSLSVGSALWYTARLRLPRDTSRTEVHQCISDILETVQLTTRRGTVIRHLSGGQVKRASLANEILCKPTLLFLDEVTSGLDEQTDQEMMNLFRSIADAGKTVVCITHSLANVERTCHLVVILTTGGKLAFVGKPVEACQYFGIERLGDVYNRMKENDTEHWKQQFIRSPYYQRYVTSRLPARTSQHSPQEQGGTFNVVEPVLQCLSQFFLLTRRYLSIWLGDKLSLLAMLGQSFLVALLLIVVFGNLDDLGKKENPADKIKHGRDSVSLFFLLAVSSFWFGCNNAAKEVVKERVIYTRERDFNLRVLGYYASKLTLLSIFSCVQTVFLYALVRWFCVPPGPWFGQCLVMLILSVVGTMLGLTISTLSTSEEMAVTLIPMAIIPQIILSGVFGRLTGAGKVLAMIFSTTYWGKRALDGMLPEETAKFADVDQHNEYVAALVLIAHGLLFLVFALVVLYAQGFRKQTLLRLLK